MGLDKSFLAQSYSRMSDNELLSIAANEIKDLTPEAIEVLREELMRRRLGEGLESVIAVQLNEFSDEVMEKYLQLIRQQPCPYCSGQNESLNAINIYINHYEDFYIGCPSCLDKMYAGESEDKISYDIPVSFKGIAGSVKQAVYYENLIKQVRSGKPSNALLLFVRERVGELELSKDNPEKMARLLKNPNARYF